jgi:DNA modification methylase
VTWRILKGDCTVRMRELDAGSIQTVVTSPPYWGLRDYGTASWEGGDAACDHADRSRDGTLSMLNQEVIAEDNSPR